MAITDPLVLPADVTLLASDELPDDVRRQAGCEPGEVVLTRRRARASSVVIGPDTAAMLDTFRTPQTIVDAVLAYSRTHGADAEATLDSAYPALQRLLEAGLLVPAGAADRVRITPTMEAGGWVRGWQVVRCVQLLDDVEVYQVRGEGPGYAALKLLRPGAAPVAAELLRVEAAALGRLAGGPVPALLESATHDGRPMLITRWCPGVPADRRAGELRQERDGPNWPALLRLCVAVADAYAALHDRGVMHGDVHPRNILVAADGTVTLIDFGLARLPDDGPGVAGRGGVGFLLEPEVAAARLAGRPPPAASEPGEQYALAAMLYLLVTGEHYLAFGLDERQAMAQIAAEPPVPFPERGTPPWPELEAVLATALAKRPEDRHSSTAELAARLRAIPGPAAPAPSRPAPARAGAGLVTDVLQRVDLSGPLLPGAGPAPPRSSVTYGAGGIAYALYRIACHRADARLLSLADVWAQRAARPPGDSEDWLNETAGVTRDRVGEVSPYHRLPGVRLVQAMVAHATGNVPLRRAAVDGFLAGSRADCAAIDVTLGRSGTLLACGLLRDCLGGEDTGGAELAAVTAYGAALAADLVTRVDGYAPVHDCPELDYLGAAHGWAGVLYALLVWYQVTGEPVPGAVRRRLDQLADLALPAGRGVRWPVRTARQDPSGDTMPGWCNGSAGQVHLWATAHEWLGDERYLTLAEGAGWHTWEEPPGVASLCCGLAGRGYALLRLHRHTDDPVWLRRGHDLAAAAVAAVGSGQDPGGFPDSLYKGRVGVALLVEELSAPAAAAMPLFERERWSGPA